MDRPRLHGVVVALTRAVATLASAVVWAASAAPSTSVTPAAPAALAAREPAPPGPDAGAKGDAARGEAVYSRCLACHALGYDRTGPRHCGLFGRKAGTVPGFEYSDAMKRAGIVWTAASVDRFLADPQGTVPGTTMGYAGVPDPGDRADLIAFLAQADDSPECRRKQASSNR